jgi:serine/threonine protein kinase
MFIKKLGQGVDGEVWLYKNGNVKLAIKYPNNPGTAQYLKEEKVFLEYVQNNVSKSCKKYFPKLRKIPPEIPEKDGMYAMTYIEGMTFSNYLKRPIGSQRFSSSIHKTQLQKVVNQIKDAFKCLWHAGIIHGDGHFGNIIITPKHDIKIIDFGFAEYVNKLNTDNNDYEKWFVKQWPKLMKKHGKTYLNPNIMIFGNGKWRKQISLLHPHYHKMVNSIYKYIEPASVKLKN